MANFQHPPDNLIFIRTDKDICCDTIENFATDSGQAYPGLPDGFIGHYYEPGINHYITTGDTTIPQPLVWPERDQYITAFEQLEGKSGERNVSQSYLIIVAA